MPLSHRSLSAWYQQFAGQLEAGLPFADALRCSQGTGLPAAGLEAMAARVEAGGTIADAFDAAERWLPLADRLVLCAAAEAGRTPLVLRSLSARHAQVGAAQLRFMLACIYPLAVLHVGLFLLPVLRMIDWEKGFAWDPVRYIRMLAGTVLPIWTGLILLWMLAQRQNPIVWGVARRLPFIGAYLRAQGLSDFAFGLGNFLDAGMRVDRAWTVAGQVTSDRDLRTAAIAMQAVIARGERPGNHVAAWPCFPPEFVALYRTGEGTGQLEGNLLRLATRHQELANRALTFATGFYPALAFFAVAATVVFYVVKLYGGYLAQLEKVAS